MSVSAKRLRDGQRVAQLGAVAGFGTSLHSPFFDGDAFAALVRIGVFPALLPRGSAMWHQARLRRMPCPERRSSMGAT